MEFNQKEFLECLKSGNFKINIKNNKNNDFDLIIDIDSTYKIVIKDLDYLVNKINNSYETSAFNINILNYKELKELTIDILKQSISLLEYNTGFIYVSDFDKPFFIKITEKTLKSRVKIEIKLKNVSKNDFFICNGNEPCNKRIKNNLMPFNACCGNCELKDNCMLVCNSIKSTFCFDKEKI